MGVDNGCATFQHVAMTPKPLHASVSLATNINIILIVQLTIVPNAKDGECHH